MLLQIPTWTGFLGVKKYVKEQAFGWNRTRTPTWNISGPSGLGANTCVQTSRPSYRGLLCKNRFRTIWPSTIFCQCEQSSSVNNQTQYSRCVYTTRITMPPLDLLKRGTKRKKALPKRIRQTIKWHSLRAFSFCTCKHMNSNILKYNPFTETENTTNFASVRLRRSSHYKLQFETSSNTVLLTPQISATNSPLSLPGQQRLKRVPLNRFALQICGANFVYMVWTQQTSKHWLYY